MMILTEVILLHSYIVHYNNINIKQLLSAFSMSAAVGEGTTVRHATGGLLAVCVQRMQSWLLVDL